MRINLCGAWSLRGDLQAALLAGVTASALAWPMLATAVLVRDVPRFATLSRAAGGQLAHRPCAVPAGSIVEMVAAVAGPGVAPLPQHLWFVRVRVLDGVCLGAELSVSQANLQDERDRPAPTARPKLPLR